MYTHDDLAQKAYDAWIDEIENQNTAMAGLLRKNFPAPDEHNPFMASFDVAWAVINRYQQALTVIAGDSLPRSALCASSMEIVAREALEA